MTSPIKDISKRDTKAVIFAAYEELAKAYRALDKKHTALEKKKGGASSAPAQKALPPAPGDASSGGPSGSLAEQLSAIGGHIGEHTSSLQQRLTAEAVALLEVHSQVEALTNDLSRLYNIEAKEGALAGLVADYEAKSQAYADELSEKREAAEQALSDKRDAFAKEKASREQQVSEQIAERDKARAREEEAFEYSRDQSRKREADEAEQAAKAFEAELVELREKQEAQWAAREQAIAEREAQRLELEAKAEGFEDALAAARKKGESEGMSIARRDSKVAAELATKDIEGKSEVSVLQIASLEETLAKQTKQISGLEKQLDTALTQAQDLAVKAIEGSSNATSFEAIREIAMEQAKNSSKGK